MLTAADTAYAVAAVRAREGERSSSERLFDDPYAATFAAAGAHAAEGTKRFLDLPFFVDGIRLRTRALDDFVREGRAAGLEQVVMLGAGFDARALRMPELREVDVWEVDYAHQLETKRALLASANVTLPPRLRHVACDFNADDFEATLRASLVTQGFRAGAGALFVWEGVVPYLRPDGVQRGLDFMAKTGGPGSRVGFDFAPQSLEPEPAEARVRRAGFTTFAFNDYRALWTRYLPSEPHENAGIAGVGVAIV